MTASKPNFLLGNVSAAWFTGFVIILTFSPVLVLGEFLGGSTLGMSVRIDIVCI